MSKDSRKLDEDHPFRSERIFNVNGEWFFQTREQKDMGPYESRKQAESASRHFARLNDKASQSQRSVQAPNK